MLAVVYVAPSGGAPAHYAEQESVVSWVPASDLGGNGLEVRRACPRTMQKNKRECGLAR